MVLIVCWASGAADGEESRGVDIGELGVEGDQDENRCFRVVRLSGAYRHLRQHSSIPIFGILLTQKLCTLGLDVRLHCGMIQLICIDVDGTLIGRSGQASDAVWEAAARTRARGVRLAVCSGRPGFGLARRYAERLDPDGWHVFQNGASVLNLADGAARSRVIDPSIITYLVLRARATGRALELYTDADFVVEHDDERTRRHAALLGVPFKQRDLLSLANPIVRAQWLVPHADVDEILAEPHPGLTVLGSLSPVMSDTTFINMTSEGVDKSVAIRTVAEAYGIPLADVMMVGDGSNDVTALELVGASVAMGNAEADVRAVARYHVSHVDQDGLVEAFALAQTL